MSADWSAIYEATYPDLVRFLYRLVWDDDRAHDLAWRFAYGGFDRSLMHVEPDVGRAIDHAVEAAPPGATIYALPTYTAMLDLRGDLVRRGVTHNFWEEG